MPPLTPSRTRSGGAALALITPARRSTQPLVHLAGGLLLVHCLRARLRLRRRSISPVHLVIGHLFHGQAGGPSLWGGIALWAPSAGQLLRRTCGTPHQAGIV